MKRQLLFCTIYLTLIMAVFNVCVGQDLKTEVYRYINEYRDRNGVSPLKIDSVLEVGAQETALRISKRTDNKLFHGDHEYAEVLGIAFDKYPATPVRGWAKSKLHNEEILRDDHTNFGLGYVIKDNKVYYAMWLY